MDDHNYVYASKPSCEPDKLLIEVTGHAHDTHQSIVFYDETDNNEQTRLTTQHEQEQLDDTELHKWPTPKDSQPVNAWLRIKATEGSDINLPLFTHLLPEQRIARRQNNLLYAVLPAVVMPQAVQLEPRPRYYRPDTPRLATAREGYLYLIYHDKVWREIEISQANAALQLRDINLYAYRGEQAHSGVKRDQPLRTEKRRANDQPLKDIWLPDKDKGADTRLRLAYAEVQWSAAYINYLEANRHDLRARSQRFAPIKLRLGSRGSYVIPDKWHEFQAKERL